VILVLFLAFACKTTSRPEVAQRPLNIVLLLADDQGADLSVLGTPGISTPHVDKLAAGGMLFTNAFAVVPSCSPSRSSIMTGMYPHANGHWRNTITPALAEGDEQFGRQSTTVDKVGIHEYLTTLPELLRDNGYYTAITQKFHMSPPWKFPFTSRDPVHNDPEEYKKVMTRFVQEAKGRPFFIQANISPPHRPFFRNMQQFPQYLPDTAAIAVPDYLADVPLMRKDLQEYYGSVQLADACAGAIIEALREQGMLENTLLIYTGDQGAPYHRAKASAYYAGLHVPFVVSGPGIRQGEISDALVSLIDLMPTMLDYFGLAVPAAVQGQSLRQVLEGKRESVAGRRYVFGEHNSHGPARAEHYPSRMVFDGRFYYIRNLLPEKDYTLPADLTDIKGWGNHAYTATLEAKASHPLAYGLLRQLESGRPPEELYDMDKDPGQIRNLAGQPGYEKKQAELAAVLTDWRLRTGDFEDDPAQIPSRLSAPISDQ
jgi:N-sulfoglucosamine sulfohydrolase